MENKDFVWLGDKENHLDAPFVANHKGVIIGIYGGSTFSGANKNEDGALVWRGENNSWEFIVLLDAHQTSQSAELVIQGLESLKFQIQECLSAPDENVFESIRTLIIEFFSSKDFIDKCKNVSGETACLICIRKAQYLWWLNIGDCSLYLFHDELCRRGQFALNQRNYFEWIGNQSTFNNAIPCYSTGIRELRTGSNMIFMTTDGLLEFGNRQYENPQNLYNSLQRQRQFQCSLETCIHDLLKDVHDGKGRDSATIVSWTIENNLPACYPSD